MMTPMGSPRTSAGAGDGARLPPDRPAQLAGDEPEDLQDRQIGAPGSDGGGEQVNEGADGEHGQQAADQERQILDPAEVDQVDG